MVDAAHDCAGAAVSALGPVGLPLRSDEESPSPAVRWAEATVGLRWAGDYDRHYHPGSVEALAEDVDRFMQEVTTLKADLLVVDAHLDVARRRLVRVRASRDDVHWMDLAACLETTTAELAGCKEEINTAVRNARRYIGSILVDYELLWTDLKPSPGRGPGSAVSPGAA
jgi:hypothetical protein